MSWLAENANAIYILLAIIAAGLVVAWRFNERVKYLLFAAGALALLLLTWLMVNTLPSDHRQLEGNVHAMADAVVAGKTDDLFKHVSKNFNYKGMTREVLYEKAQGAIKGNRVREVKISSFRVDEVSRAKNTAKTSFRVSAWSVDNDHPFIFATEADFVLEGESWKLQTMRFYNPFVNRDQEMEIPGIH